MAAAKTMLVDDDETRRRQQEKQVGLRSATASNSSRLSFRKLKLDREINRTQRERETEREKL